MNLKKKNETRKFGVISYSLDITHIIYANDRLQYLKITKLDDTSKHLGTHVP